MCFCSNVCINTQHNIRRRCSNLDEYFGFCFFVSFLFVHFILFHFILLAHLERFRNSFELVVDLCTILNTLCEFISRTHTHTHTDCERHSLMWCNDVMAYGSAVCYQNYLQLNHLQVQDTDSTTFRGQGLDI